MGVAVSNSPVSGVSGLTFHPVFRIQNIDNDYSRNKESVGQAGQQFSKNLDTAPPTVNGGFSYYLTNAENERRWGFVVDGSQSFLAKILDGTEDQKNYIFPTAPEGQDLIGFNPLTPALDVAGLGNASITSYSIEAAVGGFATATIALSAANLRDYIGGSGLPSPAIDPTTNIAYTGTFNVPTFTSGLVGQPYVLRANDIKVDIGGNPFGIDILGLCVQNFNFSIDFNRDPIICMGAKNPIRYDMSLPITASLSVEAFFDRRVDANLADILCDEEGDYNITITLREPACVGSGDIAFVLNLSGATLDSQSTSVSYNGGNETVSMNFTVGISGPQDYSHGVFMSGITA